MLLYLLLVSVCSVAAWLASLRLAQWLQRQRDLTDDVATGIFMICFLLGLLLVGVFVAAGAMLTDGDRAAAGLLVESVLATVMFPAGILLLKKNREFS